MDDRQYRAKKKRHKGNSKEVIIVTNLQNEKYI